MQLVQSRRYTRHHVWAHLEADGCVTVGMTAVALRALGHLVFASPPAAGAHVEAGRICGVLESMQAASTLHAPLSGVVQAANPDAEQHPERLNAEAWETWLFRLLPDNPDAFVALLDAQTYAALTGFPAVRHSCQAPGMS